MLYNRITNVNYSSSGFTLFDKLASHFSFPLMCLRHPMKAIDLFNLRLVDLFLLLFITLMAVDYYI